MTGLRIGFDHQIVRLMARGGISHSSAGLTSVLRSETGL
jgi:hypothetical protein